MKMNFDIRDQQPLVSVAVMTYNHVDFIAKAIDSILCQKTDFSFEICIGEDDSSDGTREICQQYATKYPHIIRLFERKRDDVMVINGYVTGRFNMIETLKSCRGNYIAILEGDDYWIDPLKLQKQVDYLENNPDYALCFCNINVIYLDERKKDHPGYGTEKLPEGYLQPISPPKQTTDINDLVDGNFIHTPGVLFRNWIKDQGLPRYLRHTPIGDWPLHMYTALQGKLYYFSDQMAVYRVHENGLWSTLSDFDKLTKGMMQLPSMIAENIFQEDIQLRLVNRLNSLLSYFRYLYHKEIETYKNLTTEQALKIRCIRALAKADGDKFIIYAYSNYAFSLIDQIHEENLGEVLYIIDQRARFEKLTYKGITTCQVEEIISNPAYNDVNFIIASDNHVDSMQSELLKNSHISKIIVL